MPKKIVLAYSGGLDTSVILKWLQLNYNCPIVTFTADLGQEDELALIKEKASSLGVKEIFIENLQEEFVRNYVFPMFRANTLYEGTYLLGTAIARPLIAKRQIEIANIVGMRVRTYLNDHGYDLEMSIPSIAPLQKETDDDIYISFSVDERYLHIDIKFKIIEMASA